MRALPSYLHLATWRVEIMEVFIHEICVFLGYNAASSGNPLPTFRDNVSVPSSRVKKSKRVESRQEEHAVYVGRSVGWGQLSGGEN
jgi:hypothetical protein